MFHNWRHTFPLYEGYVRIIFKRVDALGPPPADLNDRVLVRLVPARQPVYDADWDAHETRIRRTRGSTAT